MTASNCTFIRLLAEENKGAALQDSIITLRNGETSSALFPVAPDKFSMVPGSPFAYWVSDRIRRLFIDLPPFEGDGRTVRVGLQTSDDFRFVRAWWEVDPGTIVTGTPETAPDEFRAQTCAGKKWVPFAKGGEYSPYYADVHLVVNWGDDGEKIKNFVDPNSGKVLSRPQNTEYYFRPGLTWPLRASHFCPQILPKGCIFSVRSYCAFTPENELKATLTIYGSSAFDYLFKIMLGRFGYPEFIVGILQKMPWPDFYQNVSKIEAMSQKMWECYAELNMLDESIHTFYCPILENPENNPTQEESTTSILKEITKIQDLIDQTGFSLYDIPITDQPSIVDSSENRPSPDNFRSIETSSFSENLISYMVGCAFGRWDIRFATGEKQPPELPDPFAPLPACSPGMLQGEDGLPLAPHEVPADYPLAVDADGILVDDEGHPDDIVARIRDVLTIIWGDRADAIEKEACEILGVKSLRDYFRKPGAGGFWDDHVKRYSKSRRKAPIYWLLQSAKKNYAIWIYYPRMDADTLYKALRYAKDKLAVEERRLEDMHGELAQLGTGGPAVKKLEKGIGAQEAFISELHDFVEKLERAANLNLVPEHDDGVVLTIAPLWELVPWKEPKNYWDELIEGKYEWSSIGKQLRRKGLVKG